MRTHGILCLALPVILLTAAVGCGKKDSDQRGPAADLAERSRASQEATSPADKSAAPSLRGAGVPSSNAIVVDIGLQSLIEVEYKRVQSAGPPPPADGFSVPLSGDFDAMVRQAPVLDPEAPGFHEGNAYFWFENLAKLYTVGLELTSPAFQAMLQDIGAAAKGRGGDDVTGLKAIVARLERYQAGNRYDRFAKRFILVWYTDWIHLGEVMIECERIDQSLRNGVSRADLQNAAARLRARSNEVRVLIYRPSGSPEDVAIRLAIWRSLKAAAAKAQAAVPPE